MIPFLLILLSSAIGLFEGIFIKKYNARHGKGGFLFTAIVSLFSMLFFILKDLTVGDGTLTFAPAILPYAIAAGIFYCSASFLTYVALGCGSFTLSMLILSYSGVFSILYGLLFLKEKLSVFAYIGLALIMISLFLTRAEKKKGAEEKKLSLTWFITIGLSFIGSGMFGVLMRMQQVRFKATLDNEFMAVALAFSALVLFVIGLIKNGKDLTYLLRHGGLYAALSGLSNGATNALSLIVTTMMAVSLASPIKAGTKILLSFLVSLLLFREKFSKRQLTGVALGTLALVLLNI